MQHKIHTALSARGNKPVRILVKLKDPNKGFYLLLSVSFLNLFTKLLKATFTKESEEILKLQ